MTSDPRDSEDNAMRRDQRHDALVSLHALAGTLGGVDSGTLPGFRASSPSASLTALADAPLTDVPASSRIAVLHALARSGLPSYDEAKDAYLALANSVATQRGLSADQLLADVKASAGGVPFLTTTSGQALPHHEAAFVDTDVCTTRTVDVSGLRATWVYSELETDAPFERVADWVDPRSWPERGPLMFKHMAPVDGGEPVPIDSLGTEHWHSVFHEEVQLVRRLNTLLHCDFWRDGDTAAGMTYDLNLSLDNEIDVDRGFLLVVDEGATRRVRALKIVGFTEPVWDEVATMVCPFWTDWVRSAVEGGTSSRPVPAAGTNAPGTNDDSATSSTRDQLQRWIDYFAEMAGAYADLSDDITRRATAGEYGAEDLAVDMQSYWTQLATDWSKAWVYGMQSVQDIAEQGAEARLAPPGHDPATAPPLRAMMAPGLLRPRARTRGAAGARASATGSAATRAAAAGVGASTQVRLPAGLDLTGLRTTDLESIESGGATIPAQQVRLSQAGAGADGSPVVTLSTSNTTVAPGLYVGELLDSTGAGVRPVGLYVSRATEPST
jgi:hypothetical protein